MLYRKYGAGKEMLHEFQSNTVKANRKFNSGISFDWILKNAFWNIRYILNIFMEIRVDVLPKNCKIRDSLNGVWFNGVRQVILNSKRLLSWQSRAHGSLYCCQNLLLEKRRILYVRDLQSLTGEKLDTSLEALWRNLLSLYWLP